ncbi:endonuclease/exonuclease/phosphatase family protein [Actinokineospora enzanensis]|uniref:endonuclease/exonuclease/phosphatase family protein n=1 Tax=Actinokineospora enzanensis TaxID=155975 RepID=UPI0003677DA9|nr:endonuclease/exonuclease/phosphatase family protein [Actinokineospora enzanensis]
MRPFDPDGGECDERRADYLERVVHRALLKGDAWESWQTRRLAADKDAVLTLCDAVADLGLDQLDPGLDAAAEDLAWLTPDEQAEVLRTRVSTDDRIAALARAVLLRADPRRADELFGWQRTGLDHDEYWTRQLASPHMKYLLDTADFGANELLRILYLLAPTPEHLLDAATWRDDHTRASEFPEYGERMLRDQFTIFKYWFTDPFRCSEFTGEAKNIREKKDLNGHTDMDPGSDMTYWSENHRLLFGTAEYLAGQYWPDDLYISAKPYRRDPAPRPGDVTGAEHRERGRARVRRWLDERLRLGFAEWNAPGYYVEDVLPLVNLVDFAVDQDIATRAAMVLDMLVLDLATFQAGGALAGTSGRAYFGNKNCVWDQSIRDSTEVLFGQRGHYAGVDNAAVFLATSPSYEPPPVCREIALAARDPFTVRARVSITLAESRDYGVGYETADDLEFWWSRAAYATKWTIAGTRQVATAHGLLDTPPFNQILPMIEKVTKAIDAAEDAATGFLSGVVGAAWGFAVAGPPGAVAGAIGGAKLGAALPDSTEADVADLASVITEGPVLSRANLYAHRLDGAVLASALNFRPGQLSFQNLPCVAALSTGAMVWTSYPSADSRLRIDKILGIRVDIDEKIFAGGDDGPNWWTGNVVQPRVAQYGTAAIMLYQAPDLQKLLFGERTHAWFPRAQFDRTVGPLAGACNRDSGRWFFGLAGDSYLGLFTAREADWTKGGPWNDREIRAEGDRNAFILQIGTSAEFGSFERFIAEVTTARIHVSGIDGDSLECSYDVPHGRRLAVEHDGNASYHGMPIAEDDFPRMRDPFARVEWLQDRYVVQHGDHSFVHDVVAGKRTVGRRLNSLVHDTPLTVYAQNMGLLPWPLYKGIDRDRSLDHLVDILRERRPDIVGLSEMWTSNDRERVTDGLRDIYPHWIEGPHDPLLSTPFGDIEVEGGGLLLLSRHKIVSTHTTVYRHCSGDDCLANKGALHARITPRGNPSPVDVFLTHTQAAHPTIAGTTAGARTAVEAQIRHLAAFIRACRDPLTPALLCGDFNVDQFAHPDLHTYLVNTLGNPADATPSVSLARPRPTGTSESDDGDVSSFQPSHPSRPADDPARFGTTCERLDYIFWFPGVLYAQHQASARVVVEQWEPGRDMSDHYGVEATLDTTTQLLPDDQPLRGLSVRLASFTCLQPTSGLGDDEVRFELQVYTAHGHHQSTRSVEIDEVSAGTVHDFDTTPLLFGDPGSELAIIAGGLELDDLSADDSLGTVSRTFTRTELQAMSRHRIALPPLTGDGSAYVVEVDLEVLFD